MPVRYISGRYNAAGLLDPGFAQPDYAFRPGLEPRFDTSGAHVLTIDTSGRTVNARSRRRAPMNLTKPSQQLEAFYETAKTTTEPTFASDFTKDDGSSTLGTSGGNLSGATPVVVVPHPDAHITLSGIHVAIANADSVTHNFTIRLNDLGVFTTLGVVTLTPGSQATFEDGVFTVSGDSGDAAAVATANAYSDSLASHYDPAGAAAAAQAAAEAASDPVGSAATAQSNAEAFATSAVNAAKLPVMSAEMTVQANTTPLTLTNQNQFYKWVAGWSQDLNEVGATINAGAGTITSLVDCRVFMAAVLNFSCNTASNLSIQIFKNGVAIPTHMLSIDVAQVNKRVFGATITGIEECAANDVFDIRISNTTDAGSNLIVFDANFSIFAIGAPNVG